MPGIRTYRSLGNALKDGFQVYDRTRDGYLVRRQRHERWELAIVVLTGRAELPELPDSSHLNFGA
jgi:hypothetical protein